MAKFVLLTPKDPWLSPSGGTSTFAKQLLQVFKEDVAIVSMSTQDFVSGQWIDRNFQNTKIKFFCLGKNNLKKGILPARIHFLIRIILNNRRIKKLGVKRIFIDSPESLFFLASGWESVCYMFHGLNNPVKHSRYIFLQWLGTAFEKFFLYKLERFHPACILAAADKITIENFNKSTGFQNKVGNIISFPTRVDNEIFEPIDNIESLRKNLNIRSKIVFTVNGRLAWIKGWDLLLESFSLFNQKNPDSLLIFVGDGEDYNKIETKIKKLKLDENVKITGFVSPKEVAKYINVADLCLVGSFREGWSVAMCEILACGKGMVTTNVSGASDMVINGKNGFIVEERTPKEFFNAIELALKLIDKEANSYELSKKYFLSTLKSDIEHLWQFK